MPTKTDRILSYLPSTFQTSPRSPVLHAVADAFGNELLLAENSLSAVMMSHWVDFADLKAAKVLDLASMAALYGLAPRDDETVEAFRAHLKRYVRTLLEGTVTVQGILRVTAEALGLRIADDYAALDAWWMRREDFLIDVRPRRADAATLLLGVGHVKVAGVPAQPAAIAGKVDLTTIDVPRALTLRLKVDSGGPKDVVLPAGPSDVAKIVQTVNTAMGAPVASADGVRLKLVSLTSGASSRMEVIEGADDAAPVVLGLAPRVYRGSEATGASIRGAVIPGRTVDLSRRHYLRLAVDAKQFAEVDCAGPAAATTSLDHVAGAINKVLGVPVARREGDVLVLTSPSRGFASMIAVQAATAQDAAPLLLGDAPRVSVGSDARPARATGTTDLRDGLDLSERSLVRLEVDAVARTIDCAGALPSHTEAFGIIDAINAAFGVPVASPDGSAIAVASRKTGPDGTIVFSTPASNDATEAIFGIASRVSQGSDAAMARIVGTPDLHKGVNLSARNVLSLSIDAGPFVEIDASANAADVTAVTLTELGAAINAAVGPHNAAGGSQVASDDGTHLILSSPGALEIRHVENLRRRRFVTRATVIDEAAVAVFGFVAREGHGVPAGVARVVGVPDLSRGVDLREGRILRLHVDGRAPIDIDCAGPRVRATVLQEIVDQINRAVPVASQDGSHLLLTAAQRIVVDPRVADALDLLLGIEPQTIRGTDPTRIRFEGLVDLSAGVDLPASASLKIGLDAIAPVQVDLVGAAPRRMESGEIAAAINRALGSFFCSVGPKGLILSSQVIGSASRIEFAVPAGTDVTRSIFGVDAPRTYQGEDAQDAEITGKPDLSAGVNLAVTRFLSVSVDGESVHDVDCAAGAADASAVSIDTIVTAINNAFTRTIASSNAGHLRVRAKTIRFEPHTAGSAALALLGVSQAEEQGAPATQARIVGDAALPEPFDLRQRSLIRLSIDGARPVDIDVAGRDPARTSRAEVVAAIDRLFPQLASVTDDDRVQLSRGQTLSLLPLRFLELIEYPEAPIVEPVRALRNGDGWFVRNDGAADASADIEDHAPFGAAGPMFVNRTLGRFVRVDVQLNANDTLRLSTGDAEKSTDHAEIRATIVTTTGEMRRVEPGQIEAGPLGSQVQVPFVGDWTLRGQPPALGLNNPLTPGLVILRARVGEQPQPQPQAQTQTNDDRDISVSVVSRSPAQSAGRALGRSSAGPSLFDVTVRRGAEEERYAGVTIGMGDGPDSLVYQINAGASFGKFSQLVKAEAFTKAGALRLPQGRSDWVYLECTSARYDHVRFNEDRFPNGACDQPGVFNVSRFSNAPPERVKAVFAPASDFSEVTAKVSLRWKQSRPGVFQVNLPDDLPESFGAKFNESRFGENPLAPESYPGIVTEPETDSEYLGKRINQRPSDFVTAGVVNTVPLGWAPVTMPFRQPQSLTLGDATSSAQIFLAEEGINGFLALTAREAGTWGNGIAVTARKSSPGRFDVTITYKGGRFENAREVVRGQALPAVASGLSRPGPVGVLQAKAAGVRADVTRDVG